MHVHVHVNVWHSDVVVLIKGKRVVVIQKQKSCVAHCGKFSSFLFSFFLFSERKKEIMEGGNCTHIGSSGYFLQKGRGRCQNKVTRTELGLENLMSMQGKTGCLAHPASAYFIGIYFLTIQNSRYDKHCLIS